MLSGDEIIEVNGMELSRLSHTDAVAVFKRIRRGHALLLVRRYTAPRLTTGCRSVHDDYSHDRFIAISSWYRYYSLLVMYYFRTATSAEIWSIYDVGFMNALSWKQRPK